MANSAKRQRRLWDAYAFPGFRPQHTVRGVFGDPKARFMPGESIVPLVQGGRVRVLAVLGQGRNPLFPAVTTFSEDGFAGFNVRSWIGLMAPASTSADIVRRLNAELNIALNLPDILESVLKRTGVPDDGGGTPERLAGVRSAIPQRFKIAALLSHQLTR